MIDGGVFGAASGESALHSFVVRSFADGNTYTAIVNRPTILGHGSGGYAAVIGSGSAYGTLSLCEGFEFGSGVTNKFAGLEVIPIELMQSSDGRLLTRYVMDSGISPTGLGLLQGDRLESRDPVAGGYLGLVCTAAGTYGSGAVVKGFGAVAA